MPPAAGTPLPEEGAGSASASPSWEPPSARTQPRRRWVIPVAIAVVVAIVIAGLATSGEIPGLGPSPNKGATGANLTYAQAEPLAARAAGSYAGASQLAVAVGIVSPTTYTAPVTNLTGGSCAPSGGLASEVTIPAFSGNYSSGVSPAWFFLFWRASPPDIALVGVINGSAEYLGLIPAYPACGAPVISGSQVRGSVVDSPRAAAAVASYAGSFLSAHRSALAMYILVGGYFGTYFVTGSVWNIGYSTCSLGVPSTGSGFNASLNASSARVLTHLPVGPVSCAAVPSILASSGIVSFVRPLGDEGIATIRSSEPTPNL